MIEGWADNLEQSKFIEALEIGSERAYDVVKKIRAQKLPKSTTVKTDAEKTGLSPPESMMLSESNSQSSSESGSSKIEDSFHELAYAKLYDVLTDFNHDKLSRDSALNTIRNQTVNIMLKNPLVMASDPSTSYTMLSELFSKFVRKMVRKLVLDESKRVDGRQLDEMRQISCEVDMFKPLHGSALFQRGQTQVLCSVTFDSPETMYRPESIANMMSPSLTNFNKNFMLHYEFPSFATNEISRVGGRADRREIGHGALAGWFNFRFSSFHKQIGFIKKI